MTELTEDQIIWHPGIYHGREGAYSQVACNVPQEDLIELVRKRAQEDGEWAIVNGHVGPHNENASLMRRMMEWVADPENIVQCFEANPEETVDWICRDLANGSKWAGGSRG